MKINDITEIIVDTAYHIHKEIGPGLLESVYSVILCHELRKRGLKVEREVPITIKYKDIRFQEGFRADLIVEELVIVELKSVEETKKVHCKQLLTYLRMAEKEVGLLINFGLSTFKDGVKRVVNNYKE